MNPHYYAYFFLAFLVNAIGMQKVTAQSDASFLMSYFEDVNSSHSFESIKEEGFKDLPEKIINLGITKSTLWIKVQLDTALLKPEAVIQTNNQFTDLVTLSYLLKGNKQISETLGIMQPYSKNTLKHYKPAFEIPTSQLASPIVYLKVKSRWPMSVSVSVKTKEAFHKERTTKYFIAGLLIGGLLLIACYNLFLFFSIRDSSYLIYVAGLSTTILSLGYVYGILIPYLSPEWPEFSFRFPIYAMGLTGVFNAWFAMRFLEIKKEDGIFYYALFFIILCALSSMLIETLHLDYLSRKVNLALVITSCLIIFSTAIYSLVKGSKVAVYFTIAWTCYLVGMSTFSLKILGVFPHNLFTAQFMHLGTFMEAVLLSFALGHKYSLIRIEKNRLKNQTREDLEKLVDTKTIRLETSLNEKEVLLKEIHHRVKNNLQIVISFLDLQAASVQGEKNKDILAQSKARVYSMSLIHQKLYQSNNFTRINVKDYLEELFSYIKNSYTAQQRHVSHKLTLENIELSTTQAVPLGLIVNELLANSFKHGLKPGKTNQINLSLTSTKDSIIVEIADSGNGFDEKSTNEGVKKTLGLFIVKSLTKQLRASSRLFFEKDLFITQLIIPIAII
jgi:two-component sensor histidine kinase